MKDKSIDRYVSLGKDLVILIRDGGLILLVVLLLTSPRSFNSILQKAGFTKGNFVGLEWESNLLKSNDALEEANKTIVDLQNENKELIAALDKAKNQLDGKDNVLKETITDLKKQNRNLLKKTKATQSHVQQALKANVPVVKKINRKSNITKPKVSEY